ncbi:MAG: hypothetical protein KGM42_02875 [Hyphomicrobiales bacterium]|nr:hypothetical protein [Hyphomicrobiales bacterium]
MGATPEAKNPTDPAPEAASDGVLKSATEAVERLRRAAEAISADAQRKARWTSARQRLTSSIADTKNRLQSLDVKTEGWGRAAAASGLCAAIALAAILGLQDGRRLDGAKLTALDFAAPWRRSDESVRQTAEMRAELQTLQRQVASLHAQIQKQAEDTKAAQTRTATANGQVGARIDRIERDMVARVDKIEKEAGARFDQQTARLERVERLVADPVVTSSIPKTSANPPAALRQPAAGAPARDNYVLRGVHNGVAVVQTRQGLIEVGPGDMIPGVGRVKAIEKVDGRWVVVMRDGVIDSD